MGSGRITKPQRIEKMKRERYERAAAKFKLRLSRKKLEKKDPELKRKRLAENIPKTIDNMRPFDPSMVTTPSNLHPHNVHPSSSSDPSSSKAPASQNDGPMDTEHAQDIANDPFAEYFNPESERDPTIPPKVLITTSPFATKAAIEFCEEIVSVFPGAEFHQRKRKSWGGNRTPALGTIAQWAVKREYSSLIVVNEDHHKPNAMTIVHLPNGPTAYFKLTSVALTQEISGHARSSPHYPELVLNNFVTRLGHAVGRMFQTLFPPMPEFEGRQVVTLHNQRDYMFFRRHRYMFKSTERTALQEIGPRFTLKLRSIKTGLPGVNTLGTPMKPLEFAKDDEDDEPAAKEAEAEPIEVAPKKAPKEAKGGEFVWNSNPRLEVNKRTWFL